jgi:hypothetical protein
VSSHPKLTTLGISLGGQPVKHRQLARQVGERVEDPPESSISSFKFIRSVPSQGTTFVFGSWVCIADGVGNFRRFLVDMRPKTSAADSRSDLDKFVDGLDNLPLHASATRIEMGSAPSSTSSRVAATSPGLDSFQSRDLHSRSQFGSCKPATNLQEANVSGPLSMLEKGLDFVLQDGKPEATACRGATGCSGASDLVITSLPEGRIVHWKGMVLSDLLEAEGRLVAHLEPLPFQEGRPLATAAKGSTELVDGSSHELSSRQVLMAEEGEDDGDLPIVNFEAISEDEITANAGDENDADREVRRARNRARTIRRRRANERRRSMHRELDPEFAAVSERGFRTPVANIARVTAILERSHDLNMRQALLYAQRAWIQLDQHNPASTIREERVGEIRSQAHSRTAGGRLRHQLSNDNARGSRAPGGRQQPPQGGHPRQTNHRLPPEDLRQHINEGHDARTVISSRRKVREEVETEGTDCSDRFPAFSACFSSYKYPEGFKPIGITKYDGKQAPQQWLRCYSTAIEVAGSSNITKVVYFPMALDPAPLTWLESLSNKSIDSWERLKKVFIDNFQGAIACAGTRHDLAQCKQERNELLRSYTRRFFDVRATIANISEDDIIDYFYNGITDLGIYRDFGWNRPKTVAGLRDMMHDWSEQEEKMRERFPRRQDSNLRRPNDNRNDKDQRDFSGPPRK